VFVSMRERYFPHSTHPCESPANEASVSFAGVLYILQDDADSAHQAYQAQQAIAAKATMRAEPMHH